MNKDMPRLEQAVNHLLELSKTQLLVWAWSYWEDAKLITVKFHWTFSGMLIAGQYNSPISGFKPTNPIEIRLLSTGDFRKSLAETVECEPFGDAYETKPQPIKISVDSSIRLGGQAVSPSSLYFNEILGRIVEAIGFMARQKNWPISTACLTALVDRFESMRWQTLERLSAFSQRL